MQKRRATDNYTQKNRKNHHAEINKGRHRKRLRDPTFTQKFRTGTWVCCWCREDVIQSSGARVQQITLHTYLQFAVVMNLVVFRDAAEILHQLSPCCAPLNFCLQTFGFETTFLKDESRRYTFFLQEPDFFR